MNKIDKSELQGLIVDCTYKHLKDSVDASTKLFLSSKITDKLCEHDKLRQIISNPNKSNSTLPADYLFGIKVVKYRIVKDCYSGYECQKWRWWFPFWCQMGGTNTHRTVQLAIEFIKNNHKTIVVQS